MQKRTSSILLPLVLLLLPVLGEARAQVAVGPHVGFNVDAEDAFVGATAHVSVPALPVIINPAFDFYLGDGTFVQLDANALLPFGVANVLFSPYAGGGLALGYSSVEVAGEDISDTDLGLNLLAGVFFNLPALRPFAEARATVGDGTVVSVKGGVLFNF